MKNDLNPCLHMQYFHQMPEERHLYDGRNQCYSNVFPNTAIDWLTKHLADRSENKRLCDCELIRKYLSKKTRTLATALA